MTKLWFFSLKICQLWQTKTCYKIESAAFVIDQYKIESAACVIDQ